MANRNEKEASRKRILSTCVRLFLEQGFKHTPPKQILTEADVSAGTFYNLYRTKAGVLTELTEFMFQNQFTIAGQIAQEETDPVKLYAVETAIQLTLTELNENLREIYIEAYSQREAYEYILRETAKKLYQIFGPYQPELTQRDFYEMDIGSSSVMRGYMAHPCDETLTLEKKIRLFLTMTLSVYRVPADERERALRFVEGLDIRAISEQVMQQLFKALAMHYEFSLQEVEEALRIKTDAAD